MLILKRAIVASTVALLVNGCAVTPKSIQMGEIVDTARADVELLGQQIDRIVAPIGLNQAIARALQNNRDKKLKALEAALAQGQIDLVQHEMLPSLTASAGYSERNNYAASASVTFDNGEPAPLDPDPTYSISQKKRRKTNDVTFTWNLLDFGLSYVRAKQHASRYLVAKERERKVVHNITQDVRAAYWRAVSAGRLLQKIGPLSAQANRGLKNSREVEQKRLRSPLEALYYQRELMDILRSLQSLRQNLVNAKTELAGLMGLKPGTKFKLADVGNPNFSVPTLNIPIASMEQKALTQRPELIETYYQKRISVAETHAAMLKILPSIDLNIGEYRDRNDYLLNQEWTSAGAQISWNLFNVFRLPAEMRMADTREGLAEARRLATSMAVLTQVHLARLRFEQTRKSYDLAEGYLDVANRIQEQSRNSARSTRTSELDLIRESLNNLLAELRRDVAYADLQNSYGKVFVTMGMDLVPEKYAEMSTGQLSIEIAKRFADWQRGEGIDTESAEPVAQGIGKAAPHIEQPTEDAVTKEING